MSFFIIEKVQKHSAQKVSAVKRIDRQKIKKCIHRTYIKKVVITEQQPDITHKKA